MAGFASPYGFSLPAIDQAVGAREENALRKMLLNKQSGQIDRDIGKQNALAQWLQPALGGDKTALANVMAADPETGLKVANYLKPAAAAAPTNLEKLIAARDKLPEGDPRRSYFDGAIAKETDNAKAPIFQDFPVAGDRIEKRVSYDNGKSWQAAGPAYSRREPKEPSTGPFAGSGMEAQVLNVLLKGDPASPEYAAAYANYSAPKSAFDPVSGQLVQTRQDMSPFRKPVSAAPGGPQMPPQPAAPTPRPQAPMQEIAPGVTVTPTAPILSTGERKALGDQQSILTKLKGASEALRKDVEENGLNTFGLGSSGGAQSARFKDVLLQLKEAQNLGVLSGPDERILLEQISDPTKLGTMLRGFGGADYFMAQLNVLFEKMNRELKQIEERGGPPAPTGGGSADGGGNAVSSMTDEQILQALRAQGIVK